MIKRLLHILNNIISSGITGNNADYTYQKIISRVKFINVIMIMGFLLSCIIFTLQIYQKKYIAIDLPIMGILLFPVMILIFRIQPRIWLASSIIFIYYLTTLITGIINGGYAKASIFFVLLFPIVSFYIYRIKWGIILNGIFLLTYITLSLLVEFNIIESPYSSGFLLMAGINLLVIMVFMFFTAIRHERIEWIMKHQLYFDELTGLPNRRRFIYDLERLNSGVVCLVNIDDFKEINDIFGFRIGDQALIFLKNKMLKLIDNNDLLYKLNGDEYIILSDNNTEQTKARFFSLIECLNEEISLDKFEYDNQEIILRVSAGIADMRNNIQKNANILGRADMALKSAKKSSSAVVLYEDSEKRIHTYQNNLRWINIVSDAVAKDRIYPYYQPIYNNENQSVEKYECLLRIADSRGTHHAPGNFLDIAKKSRIYPKITRMMLNKSVDNFKNSSLGFTINLSVQDFLNQYISQFITIILEENPELSKRIHFEILESEGVENYEELAKFIKHIKQFGCKIAIDDFGSGYSNFNHFVNLDVDYLKIDGSLIKNIDSDKNARIAVNNIIKFAHELRIKTIAEYVHSKDVFRIVNDMGVDYSQGYYIGKPKPQIAKHHSVPHIVQTNYNKSSKC